MRLKLSLKKVNITIYFKNLIVGLHVLYAFNKQVKFCVNQMLYDLKNYFLYIILDYKNLQFKQMIVNIVIYL